MVCFGSKNNLNMYIISDEKIKYLMIRRSEKEYQQGQLFINVEGHEFKKVTYFKYLDHLITYNNDFKIEIQTRIQ